MVFSIVDIETTGGSHGNRITEIAAVKTDGKSILESYETLINPHIFIPKSITLLTGITNKMVSDAPDFEEVSRDFMNFLEGSIFVAHNVSFDYSIIKNHFEDLSIPFNSKKLCTVRLSRSILPNYPSYSLGKLCRELGIKNQKRHRAMGDAKATTELFHLLFKKDYDFITHSLNQLSRESILPPNLPKSEFESMPNSVGVYYLLGEKMEILYVGKAKDMKKRIVTHFTETTRKKSELLRKIHHVSYMETGNELIALLLESNEIKKHYPPYNKLQKQKSNDYCICHYEGQDGILRVDIFLKKYERNTVKQFSSMTMAKDYLYMLVEKNKLCPKYTGLERTKERCYLGTNCELCSGNISVEEYNQQVMKSWEPKGLNKWIIGPGRTIEEKGVVSLKDGEYYGFGFVTTDQQINEEDLNSCIVRYRTNSDIRRIIDGFLSMPIPRAFQLITE
ncbi:MAG: 3'-5' exoribonuclease [Bacteroidia bacterium]|nr:3'-5' exoribonuclease [Bacteroidia bacterium]